MNKELERIQKITNIASIVAKVLFIMSIVSTVILIGGTILAVVIPDFKLGFKELSIMLFSKELIGEKTENYFGSIIVSAIGLVAEILILGFSSRYLKAEVEIGTPFCKESAIGLRRLGILICVIPIIAFFICEILARTMNFDNLFNYNRGTLVVGILMIFVSFVFDYGASLINDTVNDKSENNG